MRKIVIAIIVLSLVAGIVWAIKDDLSPQASITYKDMIRIDKPKSNAVVASPLYVSGAARGRWYFEASFPVSLIDANGTELAIKPATAIGEWMTEEYVPFEASLSFMSPQTETGFLIFKKDNPSGLPEHDDEVRIPVRF